MDTPSIPEVKPGHLTSEFYGHLFVTIFGILMASNIVHINTNDPSSPLGQIVGSVLALLSQSTYTFSRVSVKNAAIGAGLAAVNTFVGSLSQGK